MLLISVRACCHLPPVISLSLLFIVYFQQYSLQPPCIHLLLIRQKKIATIVLRTSQGSWPQSSVCAINFRACLPSPVYCNFFFFVIKYLFLTMQSITALHPLAFGRQKKSRRLKRAKNVKEVGPSPADGPLRPIVCCTTQQHNRQVRAGRGVNLAGFDWGVGCRLVD